MTKASLTVNKHKRTELQSNCEKCFGLCCVALPFAVSSDFAVDKDGGTPCRNLQSDFRCGIHSELKKKGFRGCTVYECFGAGQKVSQITFKGKDWRDDHETAEKMFNVYPIMQQLHEMLLYLNEAISLKETRSIHAELKTTYDETERLTFLDPKSLEELDVNAQRTRVNGLLVQVSDIVRSDLPAKTPATTSYRKIEDRGVDFFGAQLRNADLRGSNLRGACLIAADLRNADLRNSDFIGADLRDADLRGADFTGCIFITQSQINSAIGDIETKLPPLLSRPEHWK